MASRALESEIEEGLRWGGDVHIVFSGVGVEFGLMILAKGMTE